MAKIAIIGGAGYVGLSYAAAFAELGHSVTGLDIDAAKVGALSRGETPIYEPELEDLLRRGLAGGRLRFTTEYAQAVPDAEYVFVCVGTPSDPDGRADMRYVVAAATAIAQHGRGYTVVVNKSTMPVGSAELVANIIEEHRASDASFDVVSNPEFLREGSAVRDIFNPDRIVLGARSVAAAEAVADLYTALAAPVLVTDVRSAELIKYASNAFLAAKISFINEIATVCEGLGADIDVVARGVGMDERIGPRFLQAGAGFGGSCFPKDVRALASLARDAGLRPEMLHSVLSINAQMRRSIVDKVRAHLGDLAGSTVAVLGLAFKPNTDDIREAPALDVIAELLRAGARVRATDPAACENAARVLPGVEICADAYEAVRGADAVVLMTEWDEYRTMDLDRVARSMVGRVLVDGRNALPPAAVAAAGLVCAGVGRPAAVPAAPVPAPPVGSAGESDDLLIA